VVLPDIIILIAAGKQIGTGHLRRMIHLKTLLDQDIADVRLIGINPEFIGEELFYECDSSFYTFEQFNNWHANHSVALVLIDMPIPLIPSDFLRIIKSLGVMVVVIDDSGELSFESQNVDCLISCSIQFESVMPTQDHELLGPAYILLAEKFSEYSLQPKAIAAQVKEIIISFGGSDPNGITNQMLAYLREYTRFQFRLIVILGKLAEKPDSRLLADYPHEIIMLQDVSDMPERLMAADLAIISGGMTMYEACCLGTPIITINQNEEQNIEAAYLGRQGALVNAGMYDMLTKTRLFLELNRMNNENHRQELSIKATKLIDGKGLYRVAEHIKDMLMQ
jgi:spore coat polysaccharide biosynthesis predicted glycosyltransferase SpsG